MSCTNCIESFCTNRCDIKVKPCHLTHKVQISECGMVWRIKRGQLHRIKPYSNRGVLYVDLYTDGGQKRLAELVLCAFGVDVRKLRTISYKDGNKLNCNLKNLEV